MITTMYCAKCGSDVLADAAQPYIRCIKCDYLTTATFTRPTKPEFRPISEHRRCEHCGKLTLSPSLDYCAVCGLPKRLNERRWQ
jgi:phage FluMu protein Com